MDIIAIFNLQFSKANVGLVIFVLFKDNKKYANRYFRIRKNGEPLDGEIFAGGP